MKPIADLPDLLTSIGGYPGDDLVTQRRDPRGELTGHFDSSAQHTVGDNVRIADVVVTKGPFGSSGSRTTDYGRTRTGRDPVFVPVTSTRGEHR
nr:hypothetical protein Ade03nite_63200 [Actinoplanes derwentensis]